MTIKAGLCFGLSIIQPFVLLQTSHLSQNNFVIYHYLQSIIMQVAIVFAALVAVASAGLLAPAPALLAAPAPIAYHAAPVLRAPLVAHAPVAYAAPAFARTVVAAPAPILAGPAIAHAPLAYAAHPTIIG